jgi:hypothetical protein
MDASPNPCPPAIAAFGQEPGLEAGTPELEGAAISDPTNVPDWMDGLIKDGRTV